MRYQNSEQWNIKDERVLAAMNAVPRERFVRREDRYHAGADHPLSIGHGQTISQPYIVAYMTYALQVEPEHKVLEIGTGSGFQTAVLYQLSKKIFSIERIAPLAENACAVLDELGYTGIQIRTGNGREGWPEQSPFDRIIVTAAPRRIPDTLIDQLGSMGRMIIPVGPEREVQYLTIVDKDKQGKTSIKEMMPVSFVPLI